MAQAQQLPMLGAVLRDAEPHGAVRLPGRLPDPCVPKMWAAMFASLSVPDGWRGRGHWLRKDRILLHPDPEVVCRLLRGPALRLGDALVIASRRPTTDAIVREIT